MNTSDNNKNGMVAVISGASGGIGSSICRQLVNADFSLVLLGRNMEKLKHLESELNLLSDGKATIKSYSIDIRQSESVDQTIDQVLNDFEKIDVLVNAAGGSYIGGLSQVDEKSWSDSIQSKLLGTIRITRRISDRMIENGSGKILIINGALSIQPHPMFIINSTVNSALNGFAKAISHDLGKKGIQVNVINPGATESELWKKDCEIISKIMNIESDMITQKVASETPLGRIATTNDIAKTVKFMVSENASFINGAFITVDGGACQAY